MAHNLFGERFMDNRQPAWHGLGQVCTDPLDAVSALELIGEYDVEKVQVMTVDGVLLPQYAVLRRPTDDDPQDVFFGMVSEDYTLITPRQFANLFDVAVGQPVETIGAIRNGAVMFITTRMPDFEVKGDEMQMYMVARNGMDGGHVAGCDISPVRTVCENTLRLSAALATESYRVTHDKGAADRLGKWMADAYHGALARAQAVKDAMELLASTRVHAGIAEDLLEQVYPLAAPPQQHAPKDVMEHRMARWERGKVAVEARREAALELFSGGGTGMDSRACAGTAFGFVNAVVETEDYRRGRGGDDGLRTTAEDRFDGARAQTKERAFTVGLELAQGSISLN